MKTIAVVQSNYVPWKGYFDLIGFADEFIILDTVQFTKNDWRNRNRIKVAAGQPWLTIPVKTGGRFGQSIAETEIADPDWAHRHWARLEATYRDRPGFTLFGPRIEALYERVAREPRLSAVNRAFIELICEMLGIRTIISDAARYPSSEGKNERIIAICRATGADRYLSGPAARSYIDASAFGDAGIDVAYIDYTGYPPYPQINPPFDHAVSILDLLFCAGEHAPDYMQFPSYRAQNPWPAATLGGNDRPTIDTVVGEN